MQKSPPSMLGSYSQHQFPTPIESFAWLCDSIPEWLEKLNGLVKQVTTRQDEFEQLSMASMNIPSRFAKRRTGSMESLRPDEKNESTRISSEIQASMPTNTAPTTPVSPSPKVDINPHNHRLFQEYREAARRKRKSASIHSGASGPAKFRARSSVVIYYDSDVQSGFESMVRCLASARNTLKKGKNATSYKARMASLVEEESSLDGSASATSLRDPRIPRFQKNSGPHSMDSLSLEQFDVIDKELEVAQTLCEIGAHQFLRDASSVDELIGVRGKLETCLKLARECYEIVKAEEEGKKQREVDSKAQDTLKIGRKLESPHSDTKTLESKSYTDSAMGIEIDSDGEDGISIDLPGSGVEIDTPKRDIEIDIPGPDVEIDIPRSEVEVDTPKYDTEFQSTRPDIKIEIPNTNDKTQASSTLEIDVPKDPFNVSIAHDKHDVFCSYEDNAVHAIEVDGDSDTESFHIDLSSIRRTR
ncbi:MAG: hypothetical protein GOMPHAMPRED_004382 [Gomphillus americanus]|uniref:Uncharacterized protein n=1 Tax=Gomphillus americanus TaxID=1940652 RepID=A0A8H3FP54_9LECA|nr:MAG: hypothetical protein GOMPHAMPRED_004382 [Gomphillus americanus]